MRSLFRTDGQNSKHWRRLLAIDPVETFVLNHPNEITSLHTFLVKYSDHLCAGYFSYDLGLALHDIESRHISDQDLAVFHAYKHWLEYDEGEKPRFPEDDEFVEKVSQYLKTNQNHKNPNLSFETSVNQQDYEKSIDSIRDYIRAGDFYQINYTQRLSSKTKITPRELYPNLIDRHPSAHACYFESDELVIHSLSPELFLHFDKGLLSTEPIKGTRSRGSTPAADEAMKQELLSSEKEQAELFMITDLLRNDLGKVSEIGSVHLDQVKGVKKLPKIWHTYSHISGKLLQELAPLDALLSMLPGGSISGCPKIRALEVIDELEDSARGIYTGSIGYFHPDGDFSFNIAIRTLVQTGEQISLGTGGGITIDSNWQDEWDELILKASTFQ